MKNNMEQNNGTKIRAIIVDDEMHARENLRIIIEEHCPSIRICGLAEDVESALKLVEETKPNLVFLDIKLSNKTGFQLLEKIKTRDFGVIFVTAYDSYAIKAIKFSAVDYLLKPISHKELVQAVNKFSNGRERDKKATQLDLLLENLSNERAYSRIGINTEGKTEFLSVKKIIRLQGESNYTRIFLDESQSILVSKTLVEFEELLCDLGFFRVHKTHLVNTSYIKTFDKSSDCQLILSDNTVIPVSRRRKRGLIEYLR
jgi:two-component system LytT family response regulator